MPTATNFLDKYKAIRLDPLRGNPVAASEAFVSSEARECPEGALLLASDLEENLDDCVESTELPPGAIRRIIGDLRRVACRTIEAR